MYPCFLFGIAFRQYWPAIQQKRNIIVLISGVIFIALLIPWDRSFWEISKEDVYTIKSVSHYLNFLYPFYYRLTIGIIGSIFVILLCEIVATKYSEAKVVGILSIIGKDTLGIYLLQTIVLETLLWRIAKYDNIDISIFQFIITQVMAFAVLVICIVGIRILRTNSLSAQLFLGETSQNG